MREGVVIGFDISTKIVVTCQNENETFFFIFSGREKSELFTRHLTTGRKSRAEFVSA